MLNLETAWQQVAKGRRVAAISKSARAKRALDAKSGRASSLKFFGDLSPEELEQILEEIARVVRPAITEWRRVEALAASKGMSAFELSARLKEVRGDAKRVTQFQRDYDFSEREHAEAIRLMAQAHGRMTAARNKISLRGGHRELLAASHALEQWVAAAAAPNGTSAAHGAVSSVLTAFRRETAHMPTSTEAERLAVQRVGQDLFRDGLIKYWNGRCAVTGLEIPELLRASHIKPWAVCDDDAERLDVFNGLLLVPNLDAAFDRGFITFADDGKIVISEALSAEALQVLGVTSKLRVRGLADAHRSCLGWHRTHVFRRKILT